MLHPRGTNRKFTTVMAGMKRSWDAYTAEHAENTHVQGLTKRAHAPRKTARVSFSPHVICRNIFVSEDSQAGTVPEGSDQTPAERDLCFFEDSLFAMKDHDGTVLETTVAGQIVQAYIKDPSTKTCQKMIDFLESQGLLDLILKVKALILHLIIRIAERGSAGMYKPCYSFHRSSMPMFFTISKALHAAGSRLQAQTQDISMAPSFVKSYELTPIVNNVNSEFSVKAC
eukprot:761994-Hanusia_phi.AAC.1